MGAGGQVVAVTAAAVGTSLPVDLVKLKGFTFQIRIDPIVDLLIKGFYCCLRSRIATTNTSAKEPDSFHFTHLSFKPVAC